MVNKNKDTRTGKAPRTGKQTAEDLIKIKKTRVSQKKIREELAKQEEDGIRTVISTNTKKVTDFDIGETVEFYFLNCPNSGKIVNIDTSKKTLLVETNRGIKHVVYMNEKESRFTFLK